MFGKVGKAVLITTGAFWMFSLRLKPASSRSSLRSPPHCLAGFFGQSGESSFSCPARAFRTDPQPWQREAFGFAAGKLVATPALVLLLGNVLVVCGPRPITPVKLEQASKVVMWTPTRHDNGEGSHGLLRASGLMSAHGKQ